MLFEDNVLVQKAQKAFVGIEPFEVAVDPLVLDKLQNGKDECK